MPPRERREHREACRERAEGERELAEDEPGHRRGARVQDTRRDEREDDTDVRHRARDERRSLVRLRGPRGARAARHEDREERGHPEIDERADGGRAPVGGERDERDADGDVRDRDRADTDPSGKRCGLAGEITELSSEGVANGQDPGREAVRL